MSTTAPRHPNPHNRLPLARPEEVRCGFKGAGRSRAIRLLYAERCNAEEIAAGLGTSVAEVRRTLHRPVVEGRFG